MGHSGGVAKVPKQAEMIALLKLSVAVSSAQRFPRCWYSLKDGIRSKIRTHSNPSIDGLELMSATTFSMQIILTPARILLHEYSHPRELLEGHGSIVVVISIDEDQQYRYTHRPESHSNVGARNFAQAWQEDVKKRGMMMEVSPIVPTMIISHIELLPTWTRCWWIEDVFGKSMMTSGTLYAWLVAVRSSTPKPSCPHKTVSTCIAELLKKVKSQKKCRSPTRNTVF